LIRTLYSQQQIDAHFANASWLQKLRYLVQKEAELDENKVIRINDTVQSFDILMSHEFFKVKSVEEFITHFPEKKLAEHIVD